MKITKLPTCILAALFCLLFASASAQMTSADYQVSPGFYVGGGGRSTATGYIMVGTIGGGAMGLSGSDNYLAAGGLVGSIYAEAASFQKPTAMPDASYRIVGIPAHVIGGADADAVLADDLGAYNIKQWRFGRYNTDDEVTYEHGAGSIADFTPGLGYWLIARGSKTIDAIGFPVTPNYEYDGDDYYLSASADLTLAIGWNQLANPFDFDISWSDVLYMTGSTVQGPMSGEVQGGLIYYHDNGWTNPDIIPAWEGFFVYVTANNIKPVFPYIPVLKAPPQRPADHLAAASETDWTVNLSLKNDYGVDNGNCIGVRNTAQSGLDHTDLLKPPAAPGLPMLALRVEDEKPSLGADYRAPFDDGAAWNLNFSGGDNRVLKIAGLDQIPDGMQAWLIFDDENRVIPNDGGEIILKNETRSAQLVIGTEDYLTSQLGNLIPKSFALHQNYPNPFNPATTIYYGVAIGGAVTLTVYDVLGREVRELVNERHAPGSYAIEFDGSSLAAGVYVYTLTTPEGALSKKMLLLK